MKLLNIFQSWAGIFLILTAGHIMFNNDFTSQLLAILLGSIGVYAIEASVKDK